MLFVVAFGLFAQFVYAVVIDFSHLPNGLNPSPLVTPEAVFTSFSPTMQFFVGAAAIAFEICPVQSNCEHNMQVEFVVPVENLSFVVAGHNPGDSVEVEAFDAADVSLGTLTITMGGLVDLSALGVISRLFFTDMTTGNAGGVTYDAFTFDVVGCSAPASVDNGAGDCICPAGETDINSNGSTCAAIEFGQCVVPSVGACSAGTLQAGSLCFEVEEDDATGLIDINSIQLGADACVVVGGVFDQTDEFVSAATLDCNGRTISWFPVGLSESCQVELNDSGGAVKRKRQIVAPMPGVTAAGAFGDPHLEGAHGEKFDFFGVDGGIYNLFSNKQFVINVLLGKEAKNHFIKHVGVCFRGKCEQFGLARQRVPEHFIGTLNKQLSKVGGHARFPGETQMVIELELCQGHRIVLEKEITNRGKRIPYFDIEVEVPGCHDDFDGALGQTYKCKYAEHKEKFTFNKSMEEHFRVKSLTSQFGLYNRTMVAPCQSVESFNTQEKSVSGKAHHH